MWKSFQALTRATRLSASYFPSISFRGVKVSSVRVGQVIRHKEIPCTVVKTAFVKPGKGGAFVQLELKRLDTGSKLNDRYRSTEDVEMIDIRDKNYQYLYGDGGNLVLMETETFEQIELPASLLSSTENSFLQEGMVVSVSSMDDGQAVGISMPSTVTCEVASTPPNLKTATVTSSFKPAVLDNGVTVQVPPFVAEGDKVVIDVSKGGEYVQRVK